MRTIRRSVRAASAAARWGCLAAVLLLVACSSRTLRWKEDVLLPDGRTITLTRYQEFKGPYEIGSTPSASDYWLEFENPDNGERVRWEYGRDLGTVAIFIDRGVPYLLTKAKYGSSLWDFGCPNPPYFLYAFEEKRWKRVDLRTIPVKRLRSNMTYDAEEAREQIEASGRHLPVSVTQTETYNYRPWVMDFSNVQQSFNPANCTRSRDNLIVPDTRSEKGQQ